MSVMPLRVSSSFLIRQSQKINFKNVNNIVMRNVTERVALPTTFQLQQRNYTLYNNRHNVNNMSTLRGIQPVRTLVSQEITKNMQMYTATRRNFDIDAKTLRLKDPVDKPLVVIFSWLQAKQKHLAKYAAIYTDQGYDVVVASITPWQLLWPVKGAQLVAADIVKFLKNNESYNPMLLHGFSVGGYLWGECMIHMMKDLDTYKPVLARFRGQIWDSAADITEIPIGVPKSLFPKNMALQNALKKYMIYHLKKFHEPATQHYIRSSQIFHSTLLKAPALFLLSKTDPIGAENSNMSVKESMDSLGIKTTWKCWDRSPHVMHYMKHKEEYLEYVFNHMQAVNLIQHAEKLKAKL